MRSACGRSTADSPRADAGAARDGKLDVLVLLGANPMLRFPDAGSPRLRSARRHSWS